LTRGVCFGSEKGLSLLSLPYSEVSCHGAFPCLALAICSIQMCGFSLCVLIISLEKLAKPQCQLGVSYDTTVT